MFLRSQPYHYALIFSRVLATWALIASHTGWCQPCPVGAPLSPPWLTYPSQPYRHVAATPNGPRSANVYVMDIGTELGRPFVFVEGIDFNLSDTESEHQLGDFGWNALWGCDTENYPMMSMMPVLIDSLTARGFHPVLIDFEQGAGDIPANATLLADILHHLSVHRSDERPMIVSGASMGGQIARIALKMMEDEGQAHCTQLYLSMDSPHEGANVPLGLQQMVGFLLEEDESMGGLGEALSSPAARQLLLRQTHPMAARNAYSEFLESTGWPAHCRTAAIANGGTSAIAPADSPLLEYEYAVVTTDYLGDIAGWLDLQIYPYPGDPDHDSAGNGGPVTCYLELPDGTGWPWPLDVSIGIGSTLDPHWLPSLDLMPGGTRPSMMQFAEAYNSAIDALDLPWPIDVPHIQPWQYQPLHSFIPTPSALAIPPPWNAQTMDSLAGLSPFDAIHVAPLLNEPHSEINPNNLSFVLEQIDISTCPLLPGMVEDEVVLNQGGDWNLPELLIAGRLCLQSTDPLFGADAAVAGSHGSFISQPCGQGITVSESGTLELGGSLQSGGATADLVIASGSTLHVEGHLILHPGSRLILKPGAHLLLSGALIEQNPSSSIVAESGSFMVFNGTNHWHQQEDSHLVLKGECLIQSESHWHHHLGESARIAAETEVQFQLEAEAGVHFEALTEETHWILAEGAKVGITGFGFWEHQNTGVRLMGAAHWHSELAEGSSFEGSSWWGSQLDSLTFHGPLTLRNHEASSVSLFQSNGEYRLENGTFYGASSTLWDNKIRWLNGVFEHHPVRLLSLGNEPAHLMEACRFQQAEIGLSLRGPGRMRMEDCILEHHIQGIRAQNALLEMSCLEFRSNDIGVHADRTQLAMEPASGGGWNVFDGNGTHMRFTQAPPPHIDHGHNHFSSPFFAWATGTLDMACTGNGVDWLIQGQSWGWPTSWPQIQSGLWAWNPDGGPNCPITAIDMNPVEPLECRDLGKRKGE